MRQLNAAKLKNCGCSETAEHVFFRMTKVRSGETDASKSFTVKVNYFAFSGRCQGQ